jgi:hypothetical protein
MIAFRKALATLALLTLLALQFGCDRTRAPDASPAVKSPPTPIETVAASAPTEPPETTNAPTAASKPATKTPEPPAKPDRKLSLDEITPVQAEQAIREALQLALTSSLEKLGAEGGFREDPNMRLSMPDEWARIDSVVRKINHADIADAFLNSLNGSAEIAVRELSPLVDDLVSNLPITDPKSALTSAADAATQTLAAGSEKRLRSAVEATLDAAFKTADVESRKKALIEKARFANPFTNIKGVEELDLKRHAANQVVERIFVAIARQEHAIRQDPSKLKSEIGQSVFHATQ